MASCGAFACWAAPRGTTPPQPTHRWQPSSRPRKAGPTPVWSEVTILPGSPCSSTDRLSSASSDASTTPSSSSSNAAGVSAGVAAVAVAAVCMTASAAAAAGAGTGCSIGGRRVAPAPRRVAAQSRPLWLVATAPVTAAEETALDALDAVGWLANPPPVAHPAGPRRLCRCQRGLDAGILGGGGRHFGGGAGADRDRWHRCEAEYVFGPPFCVLSPAKLRRKAGVCRGRDCGGGSPQPMPQRGW